MLGHYHFLRILLAAISLSVATVTATKTNRTIDDTYGDSVNGQLPIYFPTTPGVWNHGSCGGCSEVSPDSTQAFDGTWSGATYFPSYNNLSMSFTFSGTGVYVYLILASTITRVDYRIDGTIVSQWQNQSNTNDGNKTLVYNVLAYANDSLLNGPHTFTLESTANISTFVMFDRAVYTFDDGVESSSRASSTATSASPVATSDTSYSTKRTLTAIVGGAVGGMAVIVAAFAVFFLIRRRRSQPHPEAFYGSSENGYDTSKSGHSGIMTPYHGVNTRSPETRASGVVPDHVSPYDIYGHEGGNDSHTVLSSTADGTMIMSSSTDNNNSPPGALGAVTRIISPRRTGLSEKQISARNARQAELAHHMQQIEAEMDNLGPQTESLSSRGDRDEMGAMRQQMDAMRAQIERLQAEQQSPWAQGLTDEPPPGYEAEGARQGS